MKKINKNGFTLVEMLVVIAIIGILMALLFPAFTTVIKKAKITKSKTEVSQIDLAWKQYLIDYKKFPTSMNGVTLMDKNTVEILTGDNRRETMYMELDPEEPYQDPWQQTYKVSLSTDIPQNAYDGTDVYKQVLVWSAGPDKIEDTKDDIRNWKKK
jgi:type II secretion system protein G